MKPDLSINSERVSRDISRFIKETVSAAGFSKTVVGLSGGIDSAVSCTLAVKALGRENVHVGIFPYGELSHEGGKDAGLLTDWLSVEVSNIHRIDIKPLVDPIIRLDSSIDNVRKGNIMARMRMILLYDLSKKIPALVLGTENRTEHLLGYFTRFGDGASDIEPIVHLYKTQVRLLAKHLNIPDKIIDKAPTAGLWQGQTDEGEFGFSYEEADKILNIFIDRKAKEKEILSSGFRKETVREVLSRYNSNRFKQKLPYFLP